MNKCFFKKNIIAFAILLVVNIFCGESTDKQVDQELNKQFDQNSKGNIINGKDGKSGILELAKYLRIQTEGKSEDIICGEICEKLKGKDGNPGKDGKDGKDALFDYSELENLKINDIKLKEELDLFKKILYYYVPISSIFSFYLLFKMFNNKEDE